MAAGYSVALVDVPLDRPLDAPLEALRAGPVDGFLYFSVEPPGAAARAASIVVVIEADPGGLPVGAARHRGRHRRDDGAPDRARAPADRPGRLAAVRYPTFELRTRALARPRWSASGWRRRRAVRGLGLRLRRRRAGGGQLLDSAGTADRVYCDDDILAGGVYLAARERGLRIPEDLSVVGFDDLDFAHVLWPPLTTVSADAEQLGAVAFETLAAADGGRGARGAAGSSPSSSWSEARRRRPRADVSGGLGSVSPPCTICSYVLRSFV